MRALYRPHIGAPWQDCLILGRHPGGLVLREVGRRFRGVWLATLDQVRVEGPGSFSPGASRIIRAPRGVPYGEVVESPARGLAGFSHHGASGGK